MNAYKIDPAGREAAETIHSLARATWWDAYSHVLKAEQISFMLETIYNCEALEDQMVKGERFYIISKDSVPAGFVSCSFNKEQHSTHIHKLYISPSFQGGGLGKKLINKVMDIARSHRSAFVSLNVNRANPALAFYQKLGFSIWQSVDIPYYNFILDDYILRRFLA